MRGSIREKRPNTWELMVELPHDPVTGARRRKWATVHGSKRKAQFELQKLLIQAQEAKARASSASMDHIVTSWLAAAKAHLTPKTYEGYAWRVRKHILPAIGMIPIDELSGAHLDSLYSSLVAEGCKPANVRQTHAVIRSALSQAIKWGWVDHNVALRATPPKLPATKAHSPTIDQLQEILKEARASHPQWEAMIALAALTGLRRGELCALRWSDLDPFMIHVRRSLSYTPATGITEGPTKTRQERRVSVDPLTQAVVDRQVEELRRSAAELGVPVARDPFLFFGEPDGSKPLHPDSISKVFRRVADKFGWKDLHFHSLRHFTATQLIAAGVDIRTVSGRLGHSDPSITLRVYSHVLEAKDKEAGEIMGRLLGA